MTTSPASNATLELNSVVCGAISSVLTKATDAANASRATRPAGTVFGSVIMKKRKISTSGEVTITHQNREPHTGVNDQRAVMQCPEAATTPMPAASVIQNAADMASRCRRRVMSTPPTMMIRYASAIQTPNGAHQKSSGSTRVLPRIRKAATRPTFDGLNTWEPRYLIRYFVSRESPATMANRYQPCQLQ